MRTMAAGQFKAKCLSVMDEIAATGEALLVTKRGRPGVRSAAADEPVRSSDEVDSLFGCLRGVLKRAELAAPRPAAATGQNWERIDEGWERIRPESGQ